MRHKIINPPFAVNRRDTAELDIAVALLPIIIWAIFVFSWQALAPILVGAVSCVLLDCLVCVILRKGLSVSVMSSALTGVLIGLSVSVHASVFAMIIGSVAAIIVAKYSFVVFAKHGSLFSGAVIGMLSASLVSSESEQFIQSFRHGEMPSEKLIDLFIGNTYGALGKVSTVLALAAGIYLILRRVISLRVFLSALITFASLSLLLYPEWTTYTDNMIYQTVCGGFVFCLVFAACDRTLAPVTSLGKIIYGIIFALVAFCLRCYTGVSQPELIGAFVTGLLAKPLDIAFKGQPFGGNR